MCLLDNLSLHLADIGHQEDSLQAIWEAVNIRRRLAADNPAAFNLDLALSLSLRLSDMVCPDDAFEAIHQAVHLYQQLAADCPVAFNSYLQDAVEIRKRITARKVSPI